MLNLKAPSARDALRKLARRSDVLIENFRPGVMKNFGLDYESLGAENPGLVYASISGYGQTGPDAAKGGFDLVAQGVSGLMSVTGEPGGPPVKVGVPLHRSRRRALRAFSDPGGADLSSRKPVAASTSTRRSSRRGSRLSVWEASEFFAGGGIPQPMGSAHRMSARTRLSDAPMATSRWQPPTIACSAGLCELLGHPEWTTNPDYVDDTRRVRHRAEAGAP